MPFSSCLVKDLWMHFYVDETGQTGRNFWQTSQSSPTECCRLMLIWIRLKGSSRNTQTLACSACTLRNCCTAFLTFIDTLLVLQKKHRIRFDIWQVVKGDHAIISFFDQVFDQGKNPAVPWSAYWPSALPPAGIWPACLMMNLLQMHGRQGWRRWWACVGTFFCTVSDELISRTAASALDQGSKQLITDAWTGRQPILNSWAITVKPTRKGCGLCPIWLASVRIVRICSISTRKKGQYHCWPAVTVHHPAT